MIARAERAGRGELVTGFRRKQKRKPRRLVEAAPQDWARWDRWAKLEGLNWSEFTRRALEQRGASVEDLLREVERVPSLRARLPGLSEKPTPKKGVAKRGKSSRPGAREKGSSRS